MRTKIDRAEHILRAPCDAVKGAKQKHEGNFYEGLDAWK